MVGDYNERMKTKTRYSPIEKMIEGISKCLDEKSAKRLLRLRADPELQAHLNQLADKCGEGTLTPDEHAEYGACVKLGTYIAMLKSMLRKRLARKGDS